MSYRLLWLETHGVGPGDKRYWQLGLSFLLEDRGYACDPGMKMLVIRLFKGGQRDAPEESHAPISTIVNGSTRTNLDVTEDHGSPL